jgi:glycosyltransferase involved in cell wall biosynthesis
MLSITYYYREPRKTGVSIEGIFRLVKECLKYKVDIKEFYCDAGASRIRNIMMAGKATGEINHITGDVNFLALGLRGKKNILTVHDLGHYETLKKRSLIKFIIYRDLWFKYPLKYINIVTVVSDFTKQKLIEYFGFPEDRIRVIPNPIKPVFKYVKKDRLNERPRILMLGTGKHKNLDGLIEATKDLGVHIDIIGWPSADELEKLGQYKITYTIYNGLTDDEVNERYIACDILFMASLYEGFGMPIIEAQAVGRPVITSNIGAMKEVAGTSAVLVNPNSVAEIRDALVRLTSDQEYYDKIAALGRANTAPFQYETIAQQYLKVYQELA